MQGSIIFVVLCGCLSVDLSVSARLFVHFLSLFQCRVSWFSWSCLLGLSVDLSVPVRVFYHFLSLLQCRVSWFSSSTCCWAGRCAASTSWRSSSGRRMRSSSSQRRQPGARAHAHWDADAVWVEGEGRQGRKGWEETKNGLGEGKWRVGGRGVGDEWGGWSGTSQDGRVHEMGNS